MNRITLPISLLAGAMGLASGLPASAVTQTRNLVQTGENMCTLSIPTTDTKVRPKASGYRNEGTTNQFVICGFGSVAFYADNKGIRYAQLFATSIDGQPHSITCTFVAVKSSWAIPVPENLAYFTKTYDNVGTSGFDTLGISAVDFGGAYGDPFYNGGLSVTCILPPQVAIIAMNSTQLIDVGN